MISHFILNLQDMPTVTSNSTDPFQPPSANSDPSQLSSVRFNSIFGNLGASLRDGSHEDDVDEEDVDGMTSIAILDTPQDEEEMCVGVSSAGSVDVGEENVAGPSRCAAARTQGLLNE